MNNTNTAIKPIGLLILLCMLFSGCKKDTELKADGITIEGGFNPAVSVEYSSMSTTNSDYPYILSNVDTITAATATIIKTIYLYDKDGNIVNPTSTVTVTIDIPEDLKKSKGTSYGVYYNSTNTGAFEKIESSYTENTITFRTTYLNTLETNDFGDVFYNAFAIIKEDGAGGVVNLDGESKIQNEEERLQDTYEEPANSSETNISELIEYSSVNNDNSYDSGLTMDDFDVSNITHYTTGQGTTISDTNYASFILNGCDDDMRISGHNTGSTARGVAIGDTAADVINKYGKIYCLVENTWITTFDDEFHDVDELVYGMMLDSGDAVRIEFYFDKEQKLVAICYAMVYARNFN